MATHGGDDDRVRETYRADYSLQPRRLPRKPHWILASPPEQSVVDIFDDKGAEVARQFFILNPGLPTIEFTVQNLIDYVVRTLFKHPKGTTLARKWTFIIQLDELPQHLQTWLRTSDTQILLSKSPLERRMLELVKTEQGYTIKATANHDAQTADSVRDFEPRHQALSAIIKIIRLEEVYSQIIEIDRPKLQIGENEPAMPNNVDELGSLPTGPSVAEQDGPEEEVGQLSAVREVGHPLESTILAEGSEQLDEHAGTSNSKKRDHHFKVKKPKRQRLGGQYEPTAPATDQPAAINSYIDNHERTAALALEDVGATVGALKESLVQLLDEVKIERAVLAGDVWEYRKLQVETSKLKTEMAKTLEAATADICTSVDKAGSIANIKLLTEVDQRIEEMARVAKVDFVTGFRRCEARLLAQFNVRHDQLARDIDGRVLAEVKRRVARMTRGIEAGMLTKMQSRDAELANEIEASVLAKVQTRISESANKIEAGLEAKVQTHNANTARDIEAGMLLKMQIHNAGLAQQVEAGVLSKIHDSIAELTKNVEGKVLAEIDETSFPDTAEHQEEIERYVDMRARVEGVFRAAHDGKVINGGEDDRDHGSAGEAPARALHSFEVLGVDRAGAERVRHNGRTYVCPVDPDDVLGVERRRWHHFHVVNGQNVISYNGRVFVLES
ncbi:MAG: hypothetical protein Q9215_005462 [Flavoplaca cf. flavocitrina]